MMVEEPKFFPEEKQLAAEPKQERLSVEEEQKDKDVDEMLQEEAKELFHHTISLPAVAASKVRRFIENSNHKSEQQDKEDLDNRSEF